MSAFKRKRKAADDSIREEETYSIKFTWQGKQILLQTGKTVKAEAEAVEAQIKRELRAGRIPDLLDKLRQRPTGFALLKDVFARYRERARTTSGIQEDTVKATIKAVRNIIRHVHGETLTDDDIDAKCSSILSRDLLEEYKSRMLRAAGDDKLKQRTAMNTANSTMRQARSIFAKKLGPDFYDGVNLPDTKKFMAVLLYNVEKQRYRMPEQVLLDKIHAHGRLLKTNMPQLYIVYLLSIGIGLRKKEISHARKRWFEKETYILRTESKEADGKTVITETEGVRWYIRVQTERDFHIKDNEERRIPVEEFIMSELQSTLDELKADDYLLAGSKTERTEQIFRAFSFWLKGLGWSRRQKAHEMRKIFGSEVSKQAGIRAAQVLLGHASVATTESHYADPAQNITPVKIFRVA